MKIRLEPSDSKTEGGFLSLRKTSGRHPRLSSGSGKDCISAYPRQLGGDNRSDMAMFYHFVIKPLQERLALTLAIEFNYEFGWKSKR